MKPPLLPHNEADRIEALHNLLILDTPPEDRFDAITAYCQARFQVEIAVVSLVDINRQWFKSICGLDAQETPRQISFCGHAILNDVVMIVQDALQDERFCDNPLVVGPPYIRFYAGAPLKLASGINVGTLCLIDSKPKTLNRESLEHLMTLADLVAKQLVRLDQTNQTTKTLLQPNFFGIRQVGNQNIAPAFDYEAVALRFGEDDRYLQERVISALDDLQHHFENLKVCIASAQAEESRLISNAIKETAGAMGAVSLSAVAATASVYAKSGNLEMVASMIADLGLELHRFKTALGDKGWINP